MKTTIQSYWLDISKPEQAAQYAALKKQLKAQGSKCFETWGNDSHYLTQFDTPTEIELETKHLFNNQWNTKDGLRVFDWAQDYVPNKAIKKGHYLIITGEMEKIRADTFKCGYCGKVSPKKQKFCPHCLDSEYLEPKDLPLLRLRAVSDTKQRPELTPDELTHLLPLYKEAQLHGNSEKEKARIANQRVKLLQERDEAINNANAQFDGFTWLMDKGVRTNNVIYYAHTMRFCFGWRSPIGKELIDDLRAELAGFPFEYDIKEG